MTKEELRELLISYEVWRGKNYNRFAGYSTHNRPVDMFISENAQRLLLSSEAEKGETQEIPGFEGTRKAVDELWKDRVHGVCAFDNCICETNEHRSRCSGWTLHKPSPPSAQEKQGVEECPLCGSNLSISKYDVSIMVCDNQTCPYSRVRLINEYQFQPSIMEAPKGKECPRARSSMTPCYYKDGEISLADDGACVGCGFRLEDKNER